MNITTERFEKIKHYAKCGYYMYAERYKYEDFEKMAEWMHNQFYFILTELKECEK